MDRILFSETEKKNEDIIPFSFSQSELQHLLTEEMYEEIDSSQNTVIFFSYENEHVFHENIDMEKLSQKFHGIEKKLKAFVVYLKEARATKQKVRMRKDNYQFFFYELEPVFREKDDTLVRLAPPEKSSNEEGNALYKYVKDFMKKNDIRWKPQYGEDIRIKKVTHHMDPSSEKDKSHSGHLIAQDVKDGRTGISANLQKPKKDEPQRPTWHLLMGGGAIFQDAPELGGKAEDLLRNWAPLSPDRKGEDPTISGWVLIPDSLGFTIEKLGDCAFSQFALEKEFSKSAPVVLRKNSTPSGIESYLLTQGNREQVIPVDQPIVFQECEKLFASTPFNENNMVGMRDYRTDLAMLYYLPRKMRENFLLAWRESKGRKITCSIHDGVLHSGKSRAWEWGDEVSPPPTPARLTSIEAAPSIISATAEQPASSAPWVHNVAMASERFRAAITGGTTIGGTTPAAPRGATSAPSVPGAAPTAKELLKAAITGGTAAAVPRAGGRGNISVLRRLTLGAENAASTEKPKAWGGHNFPIVTASTPTSAPPDRSWSQDFPPIANPALATFVSGISESSFASPKGSDKNNIYSRGAAIPRFSAPRCERTSPPLCVNVVFIRALR